MDFFNKIKSFFSSMGDYGIDFNWYFIIFLGLFALLTLVVIICACHTYEFRLTKAIDKINSFFEKNPRINEDNLVAFNDKMKARFIPKTLRRQWQQFMLYREHEASYYMSFEHCVENPLRNSGYTQHISIYRSLSIVLALLSILFSVFVLPSSYSSIVLQNILIIPTFIIVLYFIVTMILNLIHNATTGDLFQNYQYFEINLDKATTTLPEFVDYEVLFTQEEIKKGIPVLFEYLQKRAIDEQKELEQARVKNIEHEKYNFDKDGIEASLVLERAMKESENYIAQRKKYMQDIEEINSELSAIDNKYRENTKDYQRQMQTSKEAIENLKSQLEQASSSIEVNYIKKQMKDELNRQQVAERDFDTLTDKHTKESNDLQAQIKKIEGDIANAKKALENGMSSEFKTYSGKVYKALEVSVRENEKETFNNYKKQIQDLEEKLASKNEELDNIYAQYQEQIEKLQKQTLEYENELQNRDVAISRAQEQLDKGRKKKRDKHQNIDLDAPQDSFQDLETPNAHKDLQNDLDNPFKEDELNNLNEDGEDNQFTDLNGGEEGEPFADLNVKSANTSNQDDIYLNSTPNDFDFNLDQDLNQPIDDEKDINDINLDEDKSLDLKEDEDTDFDKDENPFADLMSNNSSKKDDTKSSDDFEIPDLNSINLEDEEEKQEEKEEPAHKEEFNIPDLDEIDNPNTTVSTEPEEEEEIGEDVDMEKAKEEESKLKEETNKEQPVITENKKDSDEDDDKGKKVDDDFDFDLDDLESQLADLGNYKSSQTEEPEREDAIEQPEKTDADDENGGEDDGALQVEVPKKPKGKPGRPRKVVDEEDIKPKRKPGRPRKEKPVEETPVKKVGRPRKEQEPKKVGRPAGSTKKKVGRPKSTKSTKTTKTSTAKATTTTKTTTKRPVGRPKAKKVGRPVGSTNKKKPGRPKKTTTNTSSKGPGRPKKKDDLTEIDKQLKLLNEQIKKESEKLANVSKNVDNDFKKSVNSNSQKDLQSILNELNTLNEMVKTTNSKEELDRINASIKAITKQIDKLK